MNKLHFITLLFLAVCSCKKVEHHAQEHPIVENEDASHKESSENNKTETEEGGNLAERPSDLDLALNARITWNVDPEVYLEKINLEELEQAPESFDIEKLKGLVKIEAVTFDKGVFLFTDEDFPNFKLMNVKWNGAQQKIEFKLAYKNITGRLLQSLPLKLTDYYALRFKVNTSFIETHYLHGVYRYAGSFLGQLLSFDTEKYLPEFYSKGISVPNNTMTITFSVHDKLSNRDLGIKVTKELRGFKAQDELLKSITIGATEAVHTQAVKVMERYKNTSTLKNYLNNKILNQKWMQQMEYIVDNHPLHYTERQSDQYSHPVEIIEGEGPHLDIYLENPIWRLETAELDGRNLKLKVRLRQVNHTDLRAGVFYDIVIPNVL